MLKDLPEPKEPWVETFFFTKKKLLRNWFIYLPTDTIYGAGFHHSFIFAVAFGHNSLSNFCADRVSLDVCSEASNIAEETTFWIEFLQKNGPAFLRT